LAYRILSDGSAYGIYRGPKLSDFIAGNKCDYYNARDVINADKSDKKKGSSIFIGKEIENHAITFETILRTTMFR
jgi:hypothetical protein